MIKTWDQISPFKSWKPMKASRSVHCVTSNTDATVNVTKLWIMWYTYGSCDTWRGHVTLPGCIQRVWLVRQLEAGLPSSAYTLMGWHWNRRYHSTLPGGRDNMAEIIIQSLHVQTGSRTTPHWRIIPHRIKIKPNYCPPGPLSLGQFPTITPHHGPLPTSKTTHQDQYLYGGELS